MQKELHLVAMFFWVLAAGAMPTANDLASAKSEVRELTSAMGASAVAEFVGKAETEAQRYALSIRAAELYAKAKNYAAAAATLKSLYTLIPDLPPANMAEEIRNLAQACSFSGKDAPQLLLLLKQSHALERALKGRQTDKQIVADLRASLDQWSEALKLFATLGGRFAQTVANETGKKDLMEAADFWWAYTPAAEIVTDDVFKQHARQLYRTCLDENLVSSPIKIALMEKRVRASNPGAKEDPAQTDAGDPSASARKTDPGNDGSAGGVVIPGFRGHKFGEKKSKRGVAANLSSGNWTQQSVSYKNFTTMKLGYGRSTGVLGVIRLTAEYPRETSRKKVQADLLAVKDDLEQQLNIKFSGDADSMTYEDERYSVNLTYKSSTKVEQKKQMVTGGSLSQRRLVTRRVEIILMTLEITDKRYWEIPILSL